MLKEKKTEDPFHFSIQDDWENRVMEFIARHHCSIFWFVIVPYGIFLCYLMTFGAEKYNR
jgi:hypothetical protein